MTKPSTPVRLVGCDEVGPSDPVRITNWADVAQLDEFTETDALFRSLSDGAVDQRHTLSITTALVSGVRRVSVVYTANQVILSDVVHDLGAGAIVLNTADVVAPTTYYVYAHVVGGALTIATSITNPEDDPAVTDYAWIAIVRFKSVAGTATVYYLRRAYSNLNQLAHFISEWDMLRVPVWVDGGAITINATTGVVDMEALNYRRLRFDGTINAITAGVMVLSDETTTHANLETVTTYLDGSAITGGRYHKVLLGAITSLNAAYPFVLIRQGKPAVEYTTLAEAVADIERQAATAFPVAYRGMVFPLAYIAMQVGDASDLTTIDLRATGITGTGGGGGGITDHGLLSGLGDDDHAQYLLTAGTRALTGDLNVGTHNVTNVGTVDGVDLAAHVADADAHHDAITLTAAADALLQLSTQEIGLDTQTANLVLAGPASGAAAAPAFRALAAADLTGARAYGGLYVQGGAATQAYVAATPQKLTQFAANLVASNTTPDHANDQVTVTNAGVYRITGDLSFTCSANNTTVVFRVAVDGVQSVVGGQHRTTNTNQNIAVSFSGLLTLTAGQVLTIIGTVTGNTNIGLTYGQLTVERVG